jgi:glycylpeptide N-tetradecanoyltransferase
MEYQIQTLNITHLDQIYMLLNENYISDKTNILNYTYGKDFVKWYLRLAHPDLIIGITYHKLLVGLVIGVMVQTGTSKIPYINFLCVHHKFRKRGLSKKLIQELETRLEKMEMKKGVFQLTSSQIGKSSLFTSLPNSVLQIPDIAHYAIPINYAKLKKLEFVTEEMKTEELVSNPLHLISQLDLKEITYRLNTFTSKVPLRIHFDGTSANLYLKPRKNICYSFAKYSDVTPTDFINVYKHYYYVKEHQELITVAQLGFYYTETLTLTELVTFLLDKLKIYGFDQLVFKHVFLNDTINITKYSTCDASTYYVWDEEMKGKMKNGGDVVWVPV